MPGLWASTLRKRLATTDAQRMHCQVLPVLVCVTLALPVPTGPGWDKIAAQVEVVQTRKQLRSLQARILIVVGFLGDGTRSPTAGAANAFGP